MLLSACQQFDNDLLDDDLEMRALQVNEGRLTFIAAITDRAVLHADTELRLTRASLHSGWVNMRQCYRQLDATARIDVVYAYRDMKNMRVTRQDKISEARLKAQTVELRQVETGAVLCVQAEVRILQRLPEQTYVMENGPYHRKFLDGYYPYHVGLRVHYPETGLKLRRLTPQAQPGFEVTQQDDAVSIETWFEGELRVRFEFQETGTP